MGADLAKNLCIIRIVLSPLIWHNHPQLNTIQNSSEELKGKSTVAHIYVVDDDEQLLRMVGLMLERGGHTASLVSNPIEGLELIKEDLPDMAILDVMMPGMNGHDVCQALRENEATRELPIMILTARAQEWDKDTALQSGADDYLSKPVTSQELLTRVDQLLTSKSKVEDKPAAPTITTFYSFSGGVGRTTLAVNFAATLQRETNSDVCLVDLTTSGGQAAMHLRIQAKNSWANLLDIKNLNESILKAQLVRHHSGLHILASPNTLYDPNVLSADFVAQVIAGLSGTMAHIVFDCPAVYSPAVVHALGHAHVGFHVITPDVMSVQTAVRAERFLRQKSQFKFNSFLLNQVSPEPQLSKATVERGINTTLNHHINYDSNQARALAQGTPLALTSAKSALPTQMIQLATVVAELKVGE